MKALNITDFQNNKDVLCTLESEDSGLSVRSYMSGNDCSIIVENNLSKKAPIGLPRGAPSLQHDSNFQKSYDTPSLPLDSYLVKKQNVTVHESKSYRRALRSPSPLVNNSQGRIPPYKHSRKFHSHHYYFHPSHQRQNSRENSAISTHTKRSSVSFVEKTNVSGWSFMLTSPALNIYNLIHKESKGHTTNTIRNEEVALSQIDNQMDLTSFEVEVKHNKKLYDIGIQIFNHDCIKGIVFFFLFKLVKPNARDIALFLHKGDLPFAAKKSNYQLTQLLTNSQIKETADIITFYTSFFQFQGLSFIEALRIYFKNFTVDNDPDKIDCILRGFTKKYYQVVRRQQQPIKAVRERSFKKEVFETPESVHMLAFATVMLDIELNHSVDRDLSIDQYQRDTITKSEFSRSLAYVNGGESFSKEFIDQLFDSVKKKKIIRVIGEDNALESERIMKFTLESAQLVVKTTTEGMKDGKKITKEYLLYFDGPICCIVKVVGIVNKLKALFVVNHCRAEVVKNRGLRLTRISERNGGIPFAKFKSGGSLAISTKSKIDYNFNSVGDAGKIQSYIDNLNV